MREHPAIRFLWMVPLAVMLVLAGMLWNGPVDDQMGRRIWIGCLSMAFAAGAALCFYQRDIKSGFTFLAFTIPGALLLLDRAFGVSEAFPEPSILVRELTLIVITIATLVGGTYLTYKSNYLPMALFFGVVLFPLGLFLLILQFGKLTGWW
jgi:hypothetical protein